ncbi:MAG: GNAT family N-acetyltransferase [Caulobacterales bacterium]
MNIRALAASDHVQWLALWRGYLAFYESDLAEDVTELTFQRLIDETEPMFALVAENQGCLIGFAHCVLHRGTWTRGDHCYLEDLFVQPDARGSGMGRALIQAVYAHADSLKCERVYWLTREDNATARALYDKVARVSGFIQYRR